MKVAPTQLVDAAHSLAHACAVVAELLCAPGGMVPEAMMEAVFTK
jgi:hypothetical protein